MFGKLIFYTSLVAIGCYAIYKEEDLARFERRLFEAVKRFFCKPEKVVVLPRESEASKQARFNSGKVAGDELYMEVIKK
jgi:hypothetical protein